MKLASVKCDWAPKNYETFVTKNKNLWKFRLCTFLGKKNLMSLSSLLIYGFLAGDEDDQFEEEKELIIKEIELVTQLPNLGC